jgi:hypothetical protein
MEIIDYISSDRHEAALSIHMALLHQILSNPYVQEAWRRLRAKGPRASPAQEKVASEIDGAVCLSSDARGEVAASRTLTALPEFAEDQEVGELFRALAAAYADFYPDGVDPGLGAERIQLFRDLMEHPQDPDKSRKFYEQLLIERRNEGMAGNIARLYCEAYQKSQPLVVVSGFEHVEGLFKALKQASLGRVPIRWLTTNEFMKEQFDQGFKSRLKLEMDPEFIEYVNGSPRIREPVK